MLTCSSQKHPCLRKTLVRQSQRHELPLAVAEPDQEAQAVSAAHLASFHPFVLLCTNSKI
jgi:hypothetical protein